MDMDRYTKDIVTSSIAKICSAFGYTGISSVAMQVFTDVANRYLRDTCIVLHNYMDLYGHLTPLLEDFDMLCSRVGVNINDLEDYIQNVNPGFLDIKVPAYPLPKSSHLNFLKHGSREVVTRPVHIHEHLPAMYPDTLEHEYMSDINNCDGSVVSGLPNLNNNSSPSLFKRLNEYETSSANKKSKFEEDNGQPLREISSVMMTTSGFLTVTREGKLPEGRIPSLLTNCVNMSATGRTTPTLKSDHKSKQSHTTKNANNSSKALEKKMKPEEHEEIENVKEHDDSKVKKNVCPKEFSKIKPSKPTTVKVSEVPLASPCIDIPKLKPEKVKNLQPSALSPPLKESKPPKLHKHEKTTDRQYNNELIEGKLTTEPDKAKLSIFKKITKPREDRERFDNANFSKYIFEKSLTSVDFREKLSNHNDNEFSEPVVKKSKEHISEKPVKESKCKIDIFDNTSPGSENKKNESTISVKSSKHKKKIKQYVPEEIKSPPHPPEKENVETEVMKKDIVKPTIPVSNAPSPLFPFISPFSSGSTILPSSLSQNPLIPKFSPFPTLNKLNSIGAHPAMPNLPLPPAALMQAVIEDKPKPSTSKSHMDDKTDMEMEIINNTNDALLDKDKKTKKEHKKFKKDKKDREKKKKDKRDKLKHKEKEEKIKDKQLKKNKMRDKIKKEKNHEKEVEESKAEAAIVPKLKLKLGSSSPQLSPSTSQSPKITIKPIVKHTEEIFMEAIPQVKEPKCDPSPELAKISALVGKPVKHKSVQKTSQQADMSVASTSKLLVEPITINIQTKKQEKSKSKTKDKQTKIKKSVDTNEPKHAPFYYDDDGNQIWVCPTCGAQDDGSPMIGCDGCDAWYHWVCVGIKSAPDSAKWFCSFCHRK